MKYVTAALIPVVGLFSLGGTLLALAADASTPARQLVTESTIKISPSIIFDAEIGKSGSIHLVGDSSLQNGDRLSCSLQVSRNYPAITSPVAKLPPMPIPLDALSDFRKYRITDRAPKKTHSLTGNRIAVASNRIVLYAESSDELRLQIDCERNSSASISSKDLQSIFPQVQITE
jgi:hypothetical protein